MNEIDGSLGSARVSSRRPIHWEAAPRADEPDRTPHVRAASGVGWFEHAGERRLAVIQDDASYLALVDPRTALAWSWPLPHAVNGRRRFEPGLGNKADKLDLEALLTWRSAGTSHALALGSGSSARRESWLHVRSTGDELTLRLLDAAPLYATLRAHTPLSGSELNLEGACILGPDVWLFQRGNGRRDADVPARDACVALDFATLQRWLDGDGPWPEPRLDVTRGYALPALDGVRLTFTDAATIGGAIWFLACAEDTANAYDDGHVVGSVLGRLAPDGAIVAAHRLVDGDGAPIRAKTEGLVAGDAAGHAWVVVDMDDPEQPAELWRVELP